MKCSPTILDMKQRLFLTAHKIAVFFSLFAIVVSLTFKLPLEANIKWLFLLLSSLCILLYTRNHGLSKRLIFVYFLFVIILFLPFAFYYSGGGSSDYTAFLFLGVIIIAYILEGKDRTICLFLILFVFVSLHVFEHIYPELIPVIDRDSRFFIRLIQVPVMLGISYHIIKYFSNEFYETNRKLFYCANYDNLTGLLNRWALNEMLLRRFPTSEYNGYLAFLDIDNFKLVNDNHGHIAGDEALRTLGAILLRHFYGKNHLVCRWGGDEFIVFFFDSPALLEEAILKTTKEFLDYMQEIEPAVDLSVGFSSLEGCRSVEDVFVISDRLMYEHKKSKENGPVPAETAK